MIDVRHIPARFLLVSPRPDAEAELRSRLEKDPDSVGKDLIRYRLASYALHRLPVELLEGTPLKKQLEQAALIELGWSAKRQLALAALSRQAEDGIPRLVFKGAATSRQFYANETWRWSGDIDIMMHEADLDRLHPEEMRALRAKQQEIPFPEHHIDRQVVAGTAVEFHYRLEFAPFWGSLADLLPQAGPDPDVPGLLVPSPPLAFTLALLHLLKHRGSMPYDVLDLARIEAAGIDWPQLAEGWRQAGLSPYTIGALAYAHDLTGVGPADTVGSLWQSLSGRDARRARFLRACCEADELPRLRQYRFECLLMGIPFTRFCVRMFLGTRAATQRLTGRSPRDPRFWFAHCIGLPVRRIWRLGTQRSTPTES